MDLPHKGERRARVFTHKACAFALSPSCTRSSGSAQVTANDDFPLVLQVFSLTRDEMEK